MHTSDEGVKILLKDDKVVSLIRKDMTTRQNLVYKVEEMFLDEMGELFKKN
jgi:hypothetical protein